MYKVLFIAAFLMILKTSLSFQGRISSISNVAYIKSKWKHHFASIAHSGISDEAHPSLNVARTATTTKIKKRISEDSNSDTSKMVDIVELCKRRGFIFQSSEIYSSMNGFYDYGPLGVELKNNIKRLWWRDMVQRRDDIVGLDSSIISSHKIWEASGHVAGFSDPMVDCKSSKQRFRADQVFWGKLVTESGTLVGYVSILESDNMQNNALKKATLAAKKAGVKGPFKDMQPLKDLTQASSDEYPLIPSPATDEPGVLTTPRDFNLMFKTSVGALSQESSVAYLRPETAQGIFTNFLNVQRAGRMKIPFGIAQIGKAFRNEITPRNFIFRSREFEQMEIEYFISPKDDEWQPALDTWINRSWDFFKSIGLREELLMRDVHSQNKLAHYARACTDILFKFPFGTQELMGVAARGNYDLTQHSDASGQELKYFDEANKEHYIPHVIEPSIGVDRLFLAILTSAYNVDKVDGEERTVLKLHPSVAPVKASILPLVKNKPEIMDKARLLFEKLSMRYNVDFDTAGAIGRRYRRADEVGTPFCITIDYNTLDDNTVTMRFRDSTEQVRMPIEDVMPYLSKAIDGF